MPCEMFMFERNRCNRNLTSSLARGSIEKPVPGQARLAREGLSGVNYSFDKPLIRASEHVGSVWINGRGVLVVAELTRTLHGEMGLSPWDLTTETHIRSSHMDSNSL